MSTRSLFIFVSLASNLAACRVPPSTIPAPADSGGFIVTLGRDTVSAESWSRLGDRVEGTFTRRVPRTVVVRYAMVLGPGGLPTRLEYSTRLPDGGLPPNAARNVAVTFTADSAFTEVVRDTVTRFRAAARHAFPEIDGSVFFYGLPVAALVAAGKDSGDFASYAPGARQPTRTPVASRGTGTQRYWLYSFDNPIELATDAAGRLQSVDGSRTTLRIQARRQTVIDVAEIANRFALRERVSGAMTALSPRDSTIAMLGGARIAIDYSRPSARGRRIFGPNGVLGDTLWRTGANASTKFVTSAPIVVGGQMLAPGSYVLTTLVIPGRYQLIFSLGEREHLRVPLTATAIDPLVERFTISVDATSAAAGVLRLQWDTMELSVPISASP